MTGSHPLRIFCIAAIAAAGVARVCSAEGPPVERHPHKLELDRPDRNEGLDDLQLEVGDPDLEAVAGSDCDVIGAFVSSLSQASRFRGNVYRISPGAPAVLREIRMELQFSGSTTLHFTVHARVPDSNLFEHVRTISVPNVVGTGFPTFHTSGVIPGGIELPGNRDYAIAVSWGSETSVRWGWIDVAQPQQFSAGEVVGSVGLNNVAPPDSVSTDLFLTTFSTTLYSMQLCLEPEPGACCQNGTCLHVHEQDCIDQGGHFHGQRSNCGETPCKFGACCLGCGECRNTYTPEACDFEGGVHHQRAICPEVPEDLCSSPLGACCIAGNCQLLCEADCLSAGGTYDGDGTLCTPSPCRGACCISEFGCQNTTRTQCETFFQGSFVGPRSSCATLSPDQECGGACCFSEGELGGCVTGVTRGSCSVESDVPNAIYIGDQLACPSTCPTLEDPEVSACCLADGTCINSKQNVCAAVGGAWNAGMDCPPNGSLCSTTPCCLVDGTCRLLTSEGCALFGGHDAHECSNAACNESGLPIGACCGDDVSECEEIRGAQCADEGKHYQGDGTTCEEAGICPGFGACCFPDGGCLDDTTPDQCAILIGTFSGPATSCNTTACADARQACCTAPGRCLELIAEDCAALGDAVFFDHLSCDNNDCGACCHVDGTCEDVVGSECDNEADLFTARRYCEALEEDECAAIQVCCLDDGECAQLRPDECEMEGGHGQGAVDVDAEFTCLTLDVCLAGSCCVNGACEETGAFAFESSCLAAGGSFNVDACTARPCDPRGACCLDGMCLPNEFEDECVNAGGVFQGDGTSCTGAVCGACCANDTCQETLDNLCSGEFHPGETCDENPCEVRGACCVDGTCEETLVGLCDGEFHLDVTCDDRPCDPRGACCISGTCTPGEFEDVCDGMGGVYQGDESTCTATLCNPGACCRLNGSCEDVVRSQCLAPDAFTAATNCASIGCQPRGACCVDGVCSHLTQQGCANQEGDFAGNGVACRENSCVEAACCLPDNGGTCERLSEIVCSNRNGLYQASRNCEDQDVDCARGACCALSGSCSNNLIAEQCDETATFEAGSTCVMLNCNPRGACCISGDNTCHIMTRSDCIAEPGAIYSNDGVPCVDDFCAVGACCFDDGSCEDLTLQQCGPIGFYSGGGTSCAVDGCCLIFDDADPAPCAIDAGWPDDGPRPPWQTFDIIYDCLPQDVPPFTVRVVPDGPAPSVVDVTLVDNVVTVTLSAPIEPGKWTCLVQADTQQEVCFGSLPGDVNGDGTANANDLTSLVDHLSGGSALELHGCDVDRSNLCAPPDVITLIDALNQGWLGLSLPACPNVP